MLNTFKNFSRKNDKYGEVHFISFMSSILARLAYFNDNKFLTMYNSIFGPIIPEKVLRDIDNVTQNNLKQLLNDQELFGLTGQDGDIFKNNEYIYNNKNFIDVLSLNIPQNVNITTSEIKGTVTLSNPVVVPPETVKYISIGWSNYGEIYIVADKRMPHTLFVIFRGTYSAKTAALYSKPTSVVPLNVCNDKNGKSEAFLYGIFKPSVELLHTTIEAMSYLATNFLGATEENSIKVFTTGHSLGGAMSTNFAYLWMGIKKTSPYDSAPYNVLSNNIVCISLGAPRCMSSSVAEKFCNFISQQKILYLRITTRGDPVTGLPPKTGFQHPCSTSEEMRKVVMEQCSSQLTMRPLPNVNYDGDLDCQNYTARMYAPNMLSHTIYLDILYLNAVDIVNFIKGVGVSKEVLRTKEKSTVCRLVLGSTNNYKAIFFDVNKARLTPSTLDAIEEVQLVNETPMNIDVPENSGIPQTMGGGFFSSFGSSTPAVQPQQLAQPLPPAPAQQAPAQQQAPSKSFLKIGGKIAEDIRMDKLAFQRLISEMVPLSGDLCPQSGKMSEPFTNTIMPDLSCPSLKFGGKNKKHKSHKRHKNANKNKTKRKKNKTKRNNRK
jgi:hypothetical protein